MKKTSKFLSLLIAGALTIGLYVPVMAEENVTSQEVQNSGWTHEAVLCEDDFTGEKPLWFNYNSMGNDKRILTINGKQFVWDTQDYTGWFYENVAHVTTLNVAPFENRMSKRYTVPGAGDINEYLLPNKLAEGFKVETTYFVEHYLQRATPAEGEYSLKTVATNEEYALVYSLERDGVWVLNSTGAWSKELSLDNAGGEWKIVANVKGNQAELKITYAETDYTVNYTLPTLEVSGEAKNDFYYGTKVIDQTKNEAGEPTWENYTAYDIRYTKISNVYDNYVLADDMKSAKDFGEYSNLSVQDINGVALSSTKRLLLTNTSTQGVVRYTVPQSTKIEDFTFVKMQNAANQSTMLFRLIDSNGVATDIPNSPSQLDYAALYENREYLPSGFVYYYEANDALKEMINSGNYVAVEAWVWVDQGASADGLFPSLGYAQVQYDYMDDLLDQENQPVIPNYNKDVVVSDDFTGSALAWHAFRIGIIDKYHDAIQKQDGKVMFQALGTATISPKLTKSFGADDTHVLAKNIRDNYEFDMKFTTHQFLTTGTPETTGNLSTFAKVKNGKYVFYVTVERDGVWAYTNNGKWEKIVNNKMALYKDYTLKAIVQGEQVTVYLCYINEFEKSRIYAGTYQMPVDNIEDGIWNDVSVGILYDNQQENNNSLYFLNELSVNNISEKALLVDDSSKDVEWITYDANIERSELGAVYGSATHQYDLIDPQNNGVVTYSPDGYIRDFEFTRRLGGTYQGDIGLKVYYHDGVEAYLVKGVDFKEEIGGFYNNGHLYFIVPTDAFKASLEYNNVVKIDVVLNAATNSNYPANEIYPGLVNARFELDEIPDIVIGEHVWQMNTLKGVTSFMVDFEKTTSGILNVLPILASYDETGALIEVYTSEVQEFRKGDNVGLSAGPVKTGNTVKAFLWNADTMQPLCEAFIK